MKYLMYVFIWQWLFSLLLAPGNKMDSSSKKKIDCLFSSSSTSLMKNFLPLSLWAGEQLLWSKRPASLFLLLDKLTVSSGKILNSAQVFVCQFEGLKQYKEVRGPYPDKRRLGLFKLWGYFPADILDSPKYFCEQSHNLWLTASINPCEVGSK